MDSRSWWVLEPDPPEHGLPDDLRARDRFGGRDCGWVAQMRPFVRHFTRPGQCVFDPFCGFATTLLAAALEGRQACGIEIDADRAALARERLRRHGVDAPIAVGSLPDTAPPRAIDLCLTNVPYFGCRWPQDDTQGAAAAGQLYLERDYAAYLERLRDIFHGVRAALPDGGFCIAMVENVVIDQRMLPLAWDLGRLLGGLFVAHEERLLCYPREAVALPAATTRGDRSHEYALIFQKARETICIASTQAELQAIEQAGFAFELYGSFARWLQRGDADSPRLPADADLLLPDDEARFNQLLHWLHERHYQLSLWGEPILPPVRLQQLRAHWYLRAQRRDRLGRLVRLDLCLASQAAEYLRGQPDSAR
ncbi:DNA methyltransferase [Pseudomonas sp. CGJS7]|uniref:DNA methyltransferase n=1 Tax=Pseudomonas sp. CGJS7 TaxID=3109348 RepID=UPI0030097581